MLMNEGESGMNSKDVLTVHSIKPITTFVLKNIKIYYSIHYSNSSKNIIKLHFL